MNADEAETRVWAQVEAFLRNPKRVAAAVAKKQAHADADRAEVERKLEMNGTALAKCEREEKRWDEAYTAEVINLAELKGYRAEIDARRRSLLDHRQALEAERDAITHSVDKVEALTAKCAHVRQKLHRFDAREKRLAFDALGVRVSWTPGQRLGIDGDIPLGENIPIAS